MQRLAPFLLAPLILVAACGAGKSAKTTPTPTAARATPSLTPVAATRTLTPTVVPTPRTTVLDPKTVPYLDAVANETQAVDDSIRQFFSLATSPNPSDPAWQKQVVLSVVPWTSNYQSAQKLDPPACLAASNQTYLGALQQLKTAASDVTQSLADKSTVELDATRLEVLQAVEFLQQAGTEAKAAAC